MGKINKVVSTVWYNKENYHRLRNVFAESEFVYVPFYDKEKVREEVKDADVAIVIGDVGAELLGENTLKWIQCDHAGLNGSARPEVFAKDCFVTGAAGRSAPVLAEHCIYFMLEMVYHTKELLAAQEAGQWGVDGSAKWKGLYGRNVGIIGLGNNGKMLADRCRALGMNVYAFDKFPIKGYDWLTKKYCGNDGDTLDELLAECDFVVLTLALTDETYHMFNADTFAKMKEGSYLVNMARGGLVETDALMDALNSGRLSGAGLDVVEEDPLPEDHPLWHMPTVYITPHCTPQVPNRAGRTIDIIEENKRRFLAGERMLNLLTPDMAMSGDPTEKPSGGWARMMNTDMPVSEIEKLPLDKFLGARGWSDPSEWNYVD